MPRVEAQKERAAIRKRLPPPTLQLERLAELNRKIAEWQKELGEQADSQHAYKRNKAREAIADPLRFPGIDRPSPTSVTPPDPRFDEVDRDYAERYLERLVGRTARLKNQYDDLGDLRSRRRGRTVWLWGATAGQAGELSYHSARQVLSLWNEEDTVTRAKLLILATLLENRDVPAPPLREQWTAKLQEATQGFGRAEHGTLEKFLDWAGQRANKGKEANEVVDWLRSSLKSVGEGN